MSTKFGHFHGRRATQREIKLFATVVNAKYGNPTAGRHVERAVVTWSREQLKNSLIRAA